MLVSKVLAFVLGGVWCCLRVVVLEGCVLYSLALCAWVCAASAMIERVTGCPL